MKKGLLLLFLIAIAGSVRAEVVVGKVDIQHILVTINEGKKVREELKKKYDGRQGELKKDEEKIKKLQEDLQKQSAVLNDSARSKKEQEINERIIAIQKKSQEYQQEIQEMEQKLKKPILEKLRGVIEDVSKEAKVDMTFEVSTAPIVYAKSKKDLTEDVIKAYNKKYK